MLVQSLEEAVKVVSSMINIMLSTLHLRWLNTVLRAVSGNLHDTMCFKLDKQTWRRKSDGTQKTISQNLLIKIFCYLAEFLLLSYFNENFKMEVEL